MFERPAGIPLHIDVEWWQPVRSFPGYLVSNMGRIMNAHTKRVLKPTYNSSGYLTVNLSNGNLTEEHGYKRKTLCVHCAVAEAFLTKPKSSEPLVVHHLDWRRQNNRADNLMYVTAAQHQKIHGVTEQIKEAKSQMFVGIDENGKNHKWRSREEARQYFYNLSNDEFIFAYLWDTTIKDPDGKTWQLRRVLEIQDGKGNTTWRTPRKVEQTKEERRVLDNYLKRYWKEHENERKAL